jgi:hypothetical protein
MAVTRRVEPDRLEEYFDKFNKRFLNDQSTNVADVEVLLGTLGDQVAAEGVHLVGISYDPKASSIEIELESGDLRSYHPREVWAVEEDDGFVRAVEIVRDDGASEIVQVRRLGMAPRAD